MKERGKRVKDYVETAWRNTIASPEDEKGYEPQKLEGQRIP